MFAEEQGGFMPSQTNDASGGMKDMRKPRTDQTVMPLTAKQLADASVVDEMVKIGDVELSHVMMVGVVKSVNPSQLMLKYVVDDGTGQVDVTWWMDDDGDAAASKRSSQVREGIYVRVVGKTRVYQDALQVTAFDVHPVTDHNEVTYHFLSCIKAKLNAEANKSAAPAPAGTGFAYGARPDPVSQTAPSAPMNMDTQDDNGLDSKHTQVLSIIAEHSMSEEGVGIGVLQGKLPSMNESEIRNAIEFLSNEGHLYSTIDEDHFKATSVDTF